jgi:hypothetical protein
MAATATSTTIPYWWQQPQVLLDTPLHFWPTRKMTWPERINALMRFGVYLALLLTLVVGRPDQGLAALALAVLISIALGRSAASLQKSSGKEPMVGGPDGPTACALPTPNNPLMNRLYADKPDRPPACNVTSSAVQKKITKAFEASVVQDADDIFGRRTGERQFYTTANTRLPNDQERFARWLYQPDGRTTTCKSANATDRKAASSEKLLACHSLLQDRR